MQATGTDACVLAPPAVFLYYGAMSGASLYINLTGLAVLLVCGVVGWVKGFLSQLISIGAALLAVVVTATWSASVGTTVHTWWGKYFSSYQPDVVLVRFGCAIVVFGVTYLGVTWLCEALRRRLTAAPTVRASDRFLGFIVGLVKGALVVVAIVTVVDWGNGYVARVLTPESYERYGQALNETELIAGSRYAVALARLYSPTVSAVFARVEQSLPRPVPRTAP